MKLKEINHFITEIYGLKHIIRYNNIPKITNESVAEHTFFVTAIVLKLNNYYKFNLEKALVMATIHDFIETYISDIPRNVKNKYKKLNDVLVEVEKDAWNDIYPEYKIYIDELEENKTIEAKIVNLADTLSVLQYSSTEVKLGNEGYMKQVFIDINKKINKNIENINKMGCNK